MLPDPLQDARGSPPVVGSGEPPDRVGEGVHQRAARAGVHGVNTRRVSTSAMSTTTASAIEAPMPATISLVRLRRKPSKNRNPRPPRPRTPPTLTRLILETAATRSPAMM